MGLCPVAMIERDVRLPPLAKGSRQRIRVRLDVVRFGLAHVLIAVRGDQVAAE